MVGHRNSMQTMFYSKEQKDSTIKFLQQTVMTAETPDQKIA
jgi:hypothetical protein